MLLYNFYGCVSKTMKLSRPGGGVCGSGVGGAGSGCEGLGGGHKGMKLQMRGWSGSMKKTKLKKLSRFSPTYTFFKNNIFLLLLFYQ